MIPNILIGFTNTHFLLLIGLIYLGFAVFDALWIGSLPSTRISFGPFFPSFTLFFLARSGILVFLIILGAYKSFDQTIVWVNVIPWMLIGINLCMLVFEIYGFGVEPFHITNSYIEVPVPGLKERLRIVQLSDLHVESATKREQDVPVIVNQLKPDLIVMTGDYVNGGKPSAVNCLRTLVSQLQAPLGIYAIKGNSESSSNMEEWFQNLDIHPLYDEVIKFSQAAANIAIIGLSCDDWRDDGSVLTRLMLQTRPTDFSILLYHRPDLVYQASNHHINLYLTGHTHGGQIRLPFYGALLTKSTYGKAYDMGLYRIGQMEMYVNRGLGFTGGYISRFRFLAPPEVVIVDLLPAD